MEKVDIASGEIGFIIKPNIRAPDKHILMIHVTSRNPGWVSNDQVLKAVYKEL